MAYSYVCIGATTISVLQDARFVHLYELNSWDGWMMIKMEVKPIMGEWEMLDYGLGRPWGLTRPMIHLKQRQPYEGL